MKETNTQEKMQMEKKNLRRVENLLCPFEKWKLNPILRDLIDKTGE